MDDEKFDISLANTLSFREKEVLKCLLEGMTISEIANKFNVSSKTISVQKKSPTEN